MFDGIRSFDELNALVAPRSESYDEFFGDMELTDEQKRKRKALALSFEEEFLPVIILMFTMRQYDSMNWKAIQDRMDKAYRNAIIDEIPIDEYIEEYIPQFAYDMVESTMNHPDEPYYYSMDRVQFMAENESNTVWNHDEYSQAKRMGKTKKQWIDVGDRRERESHREVGGTMLLIDEPFLVGDSWMMFPRDFTYNPQPEQVINCRCSIRYY